MRLLPLNKNRAIRIATAKAVNCRSRRIPLALSSYYQISKSASDDVRWEKVERLRLILTAGTYSVPPKQVAARLLERMLESDRANHRWKRSISGNANGSSGGSEATLADKSKTNDVNKNARKRGRQTGITGKVTRRGTFGGYEVTGWRYVEDASWHVKVWPVGRPSGWIGYTVAAGIFELAMVAELHKEAVLHLIAEWETKQLNLA
jgi:anti-sigma28 factor (negative regulator of flagellin synthesis)